MNEDVSVNPTAAALLGLLAEGPRSGYELHQHAALVFGDYWTITRSQVYRELAGMAGNGLVEAGEQGARSRRPYAVTSAGRRVFADWIVAEPGVEVIRFPLLMTVNFGDWVGRERLLAFVEAQRPAHEQRLRRYEQQLAELTEQRLALTATTVAFGLRYERAVLDWMDEVPALLADVSEKPSRRA